MGGKKHEPGCTCGVHSPSEESNQKRSESMKGREFTEEHKRKLSEANRVRWAKKEEREKAVEGLKVAYTLELRAQRSQQMTELWEDPEGSEARVESMKAQGERRYPKYYNPFSIITEGRKYTYQLIPELYIRSEGKCEGCGVDEGDLIEKGHKRLHVHHLQRDTGVYTLEDLQHLCSPCHRKWHAREDKKTGRARHMKVAKAVKTLLLSLGVDLRDENFVETPRRVASYFLDHFQGQVEFQEKLTEIAGSTFSTQYTGLVAQPEIVAHGICPHHLLPISYRVHIAYCPNKEAVGLSKLPRLVKLCASLPILQEDLASLIVQHIQNIIGAEHVAVVVEGKHSCMSVRGVESDVTTITSLFTGDFYDDHSTRMEFLSLIRGS